MRIVQKGFLIVMVPALANALWLLLLAVNVHQTVELANAEQKQLELVLKYDSMMQNYYQTYGKLFTFYAMNSDRFRLAGLRGLKNLRVQLKELIEDPELTRGQINLLSEVGIFFDEQIASLDKPIVGPETDRLTNFILKKSEFITLIKRAFGDKASFTDFLHPQLQQLDELRSVQAKSRSRLNQVVIAGFVSNVLFAAFLILLFNRQIVTRLNILMQNAKLLPKREELKQFPQGDDELNFLDEAMRLASHELDEASKYRESLMQMVAHDLRSPLTGSQLTLDALMLKEKDSLSEKGIVQIERIRSNNMRLLALINDLLTLDSLQSGKLDLHYSHFSICETVDECIEILSGLATAKNITLTNSCREQKIHADQKRIVQVIVNFVTNAIKFSPVGKTIDIACETNSTHSVISVTDQGRGISKEDSLKVFEKFYRSDKTKQDDGFGLGLAICKLIVQAHKGEIGVKSEPGKGSRFWFQIKS